MDIEIIPNDNIALAQSRHQLSFQVSFKSFCIDCAINHPRGKQAITFQRGNESLGMTFSKRGLSKKPLALLTAPEWSLYWSHQ